MWLMCFDARSSLSMGWKLYRRKKSSIILHLLVALTFANYSWCHLYNNYCSESWIYRFIIIRAWNRWWVLLTNFVHSVLRNICFTLCADYSAYLLSIKCTNFMGVLQLDEDNIFKSLAKAIWLAIYIII